MFRLARGSSCAFDALCGKQAPGSLGLLSRAPFSLWVGIHSGDKTFSLATCPLEGSLPLRIQHLCLSVCGGGKALVLSCCAACRLPVWKPRFQVLGASCDHFLRWLVGSQKHTSECFQKDLTEEGKPTECDSSHPWTRVCSAPPFTSLPSD